MASFEALFATVEAALTGAGTLKALQGALASHDLLRCGREEVLRKPQVKESALANFRACLDAGQVRALGERLGVSDEVYCGTLLLEATTQSLNYGYTPLELAEYIHYRPRVFLFNTLREVLKARCDDSQPYEVRTLLTQFVAQLLAAQPKGLTQVLLGLLQSFCGLSQHTVKSRGASGLDDPTPTNKYLTPHALKEAKLVSECLFYLYYCDPPGSPQLASQLAGGQGHLRQLVALVDMHFTLEESLLHEALTVTVLAVVAAVLLTLGAERPTNALPPFPPAAAAGAVEVLSPGLLDDLDRVLATMKNAEARSVLELAFAVLVRRRGPSVTAVAVEMSGAVFVRSCVHGDAFNVLAALLSHPSYGTDEDELADLGFVVDRVLAGLILGFMPELSDLKRAEEEQLAYERERAQRALKVRPQQQQQQQYGLSFTGGRPVFGHQGQQQQLQQQQQQQDLLEPADERPKRFSQFMLLMQHAYNRQPALAEKYWDFRGEKDAEGKGLHYFLGVAGRDGWQVRTPAGFCLYLDMLSSFARGADNNAYYAFMFVKTGLNEWVRLAKFFDVLTAYATDSSKGVKLERSQEDVAISILRFLQAVLEGSEEVRRLLADSRERPIDVFKTLLMADVKPRLKAAVLDALRAFAETPAIAPTIWTLLEVSGIMAPGAGIAIELTEEANLQAFPETIAFLQLLERLLGVSDARSVRDITQQFRPDATVLGPYLTFVVDEILTKNDARSFRDPSERWRITGLALQILLRILQRFDAIDFRPNHPVDPTVAAGSQQAAVATAAAAASTASPDVTNLRTVLSIATNGFFQLMTRLLEGNLLERVLAVARAGVADAALEQARFAKPFGKPMEEACLAALCVVEEVAGKEEFFEDLLDILDDWEQRKLDPAINPLASLFSLSGASRPQPQQQQQQQQQQGADRSFSWNQGGGGYDSGRRVPEALVQIESRSVRPAPLRDFMLHQKGSALLAVCQYVDYAVNLKLPLHAVRILLALQPQIPSLVSTLAQSGQLPVIRVAFMNRLEDVHPALPVREAILQLLLASLRAQRPNLAQVLLGYAPFDVDDEPAALTAINAAFLKAQRAQEQERLQKLATQQQQQGAFGGGVGLGAAAAPPSASLALSVLGDVEEAARRGGVSGGDAATTVWDDTRGYCLGLVLALLRDGRVNTESPELAQLCYRLVYQLTATPFTSPRILAFLRRSSHLFLLQHLNRLTSQPMSADPACRVHQLDQLSWLLQTVALEIHVTASSGREFLSQGLLQELFSIPSAESSRSGFNSSFDDGTLVLTESELLSERRGAWGAGVAGPSKGGRAATARPHNRMKMVELLDVLDAFAVPTYTPLRPGDLKLFRGVDVEACRIVNGKGRRVIDLVYLHRVLLDVQARAHEEGPRQFVRYDGNDDVRVAEAEELRAIMADALRRNQYEEAWLAKLHMFDAWKRVLEVTVIECYNSVGGADVEPYLFELLEILLGKMAHAGASHLALLESMADTCLVLMAKLREQLVATGGGDVERFARTPLERLHAILVGALACIVDKTPSSLALRGTLYAFLSNYLQLARHVQAAVATADGSAPLQARNSYALRAVADRLLERVVADSSAGPESWRTVALACLDVVLAYADPETVEELVRVLSRRGHLNFLCSLQRFEEPLRTCVRDPSHPLNLLFVWESQLSVLVRIAQSPTGTLALSHAGLLAAIVDLSVFDSRPTIALAPYSGGFGSGGVAGGVGAPERYDQAVYPVSALLLALLTGSEHANADVIRHAFEFIGAHAQAVTDILQDSYAVPQLASLRLLRVWVSVFSALAPQLHRPNVSPALQRHAAHFRDLLLSLAHKYAAFPDGATAAAAAAAAAQQQQQQQLAVGTDERVAEVLRLRQALVSYFRRAMAGGGDGEQSLVFSPHLKEDCSRLPSKNAASLSLLAFFVFQASQGWTQGAQQRSAVEAQLQRAQRLEMLPGEISKLLASYGSQAVEASAPLGVRRRIVTAHLERSVRAVDEELRAHQFVLEGCLQVLLRHLVVYCKQNLRDQLYRAATTSDRHGLVAILNRVPNADPAVFELIRRVRNTLDC